MQPFVCVGKKEGQGRCIINYGMVEQIRGLRLCFGPMRWRRAPSKEGFLNLRRTNAKERGRAWQSGNLGDGPNGGRAGEQTNQNSNHLLAAGEVHKGCSQKEGKWITKSC